jgi:hypothetical protein
MKIKFFILSCTIIVFNFELNGSKPSPKECYIMAERKRSQELTHNKIALKNAIAYKKWVMDNSKVVIQSLRGILHFKIGKDSYGKVDQNQRYSCEIFKQEMDKLFLLENIEQLQNEVEQLRAELKQRNEQPGLPSNVEGLSVQPNQNAAAAHAKPVQQQSYRTICEQCGSDSH